MVPGKWIEGLTAATPLEDAARRVLGVRLETVREYLGLALHASERDVEYVHQLRVGTRRAGAALDIFQVCLPEKAYRKARRRLRRVRRAAGAARDWDVFLAALAQHVGQGAIKQRPGFDFLFGHALGQREVAQVHLLEANADFPRHFERTLHQTLADMRQPDDGPQTLLDLARPVLLDLLAALTTAAGENLDDYGHLHRVRILGKRLRYAMEVFADCFPAEFRTVHYAAVEEMQEMLGRANDAYVAANRLRLLGAAVRARQPGEWVRYRKGIESLLATHEENLPREREDFVAWWGKWRGAGGEEKFLTLLRNGAVTP